jgi:hypothetical protein
MRDMNERRLQENMVCDGPLELCTTFSLYNKKKSMHSKEQSY